jgi:hypothetical protein
VPPKDRDIAMVFQNYALYPHMTVFQNMSFGLRLKRFPKKEIKQRVDEAARILDITELLDRKPRQLSGGQRQRVAMGRAIVRNPKVFLFDDRCRTPTPPVQMRTEIKKVAAGARPRLSPMTRPRPTPRRPRGRHEPRHHRAGRHANQLYQSAHALRRRLHRLTGHEPIPAMEAPAAAEHQSTTIVSVPPARAEQYRATCRTASIAGTEARAHLGRSAHGGRRSVFEVVLTSPS